MKEDLDFPFTEVVSEACKLIEKGAVTFQKFTCSGCGARLTIDKPNVFYMEGTCDQCDVVTNIAKHGCNYVAALPAGFFKPDEEVKDEKHRSDDSKA